MSLQLAAQHLASRGRGPDTTLVHMAPQEVAGLQALARAHGGSLTVNPETGLPEAGFLSSILPMIAGVALGPAGLGLTAMQAAMATGAVGALATGSLKKGLMAGLGAYGGAGIGGAIGDIGAGAIKAGVPVAAETAVAPVVANAAPAAMPVATGGADLYADLAGVGTATASPVASSVVQGTPLPAYLQGAVDPFGGFPGGTATPQPAQVIAEQAAPSQVVAAQPAPAPAQVVAAPAQVAAPQPVEYAADYRNQMDIASDRAAPREAALREAGPTGRLTSGLQEIVKDPSKLFKKENMTYGLAALAPLMFQDQKAATYQGSGPNPYRYVYNSGRVANPVRAGGVGEYAYFNPSFTRMADGGTVEAMSNQNAQETLLANGGQHFDEGGYVSPYKYVFDPITNTLKDVNQISPVTTVTQMPGATSRSGTSGRYDQGVSPGAPGEGIAPISTMSLDQQAQYYAEHPTMAAITQGLQGLFGYTTLGQLQNALVPDFVHANQLAAQGLMPSNYGYNQGLGYSSLGNMNVDQMVAASEVPGINTAPVGGVGLHATPAGGITGGLGINPSATGLGLTTAGANLANSGYSLTAGPSAAPAGPTGADIDDAAMGEAIAAANAAAAASAGVGVGGVGVGPGADANTDVSSVDAVNGADAASDAAAGAGDGDGEKRGGIIRKARGGVSALMPAFARGGYNLGDYSDGGRLLRGPGDGVSDSIPASIANKRPARLADGEFVIPARIVSELGNGSTEAGARQLYAMMDRIQKNRAKTVGKGKVAVNSKSSKLLPA